MCVRVTLDGDSKRRRRPWSSLHAPGRSVGPALRSPLIMTPSRPRAASLTGARHITAQKGSKHARKEVTVRADLPDRGHVPLLLHHPPLHARHDRRSVLADRTEDSHERAHCARSAPSTCPASTTCWSIRASATCRSSGRAHHLRTCPAHASAPDLRRKVMARCASLRVEGSRRTARRSVFNGRAGKPRAHHGHRQVPT